MSKEYIEREKALEKVIEVKHYDPELSGVVLHRYIKEIDLKDIPAADVAPMVHGRWICINKRYGEYECSVCHGVDSNCSDYYGIHAVTEQEFCPNCGAKMDKEE